MKTGKYSRWSIAIAAIVGLALIVVGLILLYRDTARRSEAGPEQSLLRARGIACLPMAFSPLSIPMRAARARGLDAPGPHFAKCGPEGDAVEKMYV